MNSEASKYDLKKIHRTFVGNYRYLQVTGGTLAWAAMYALVLSLWWKWDGPPELVFLGLLALMGVLILFATFEYPLSWIIARRKEMKEVMIAYNDFIESLPPGSRVGQPITAFWDALVKLRSGIGDSEWQIEQKRASNGQGEV